MENYKIFVISSIFSIIVVGFVTSKIARFYRYLKADRAFRVVLKRIEIFEEKMDKLGPSDLDKGFAEIFVDILDSAILLFESPSPRHQLAAVKIYSLVEEYKDKVIVPKKKSKES